ncbi:amidase domain-containing protein [Agromyces sp. Leaf222]|uniref:amidase domain-containing protein n=1 Tax=Agromyces sp. Leaf222 TaxID=1735688 RepID=UPI0007007E4C|nr:amidase domain-containing protein [Agromyces sp. Leaf222]KQM82414.1 hypothetical protein ASE68_03200 [Agromyces sp. Leaf222]
MQTIERLSLATRTASIVIVSFALIALGAIAPAHAASNFRIAWTHIGIYPRSAPSMSAAKVGGALPDGASVSVVCETAGASVTSDIGTSTIWERLANGTFVPNVFVETGANGWTPGVARCDAAPPGPAPSTSKYNRAGAVTAARAHHKGEDVPLIADCTYFASQALVGGGLSVTTNWQAGGTDINDQASRPLYLLQRYGPTKRWANADYLKNYLVNERKVATIAEVSLSSKNPGVQLGDLIMYDWEGKPDGILDHTAVVTGFGSDGTVLVTQREPSQIDRKWNWSLAASKPISEARPGARAYAIRITY